MRPPAGDRRRRPRARWLAAATAACALAAAAAAAAATAQTADTVAVRDPVDTAGGFDLTRVQLGRAPDGRLRAALTLAAPWRMRDLPADDGPPGSLCLRMWTVTRRPGTFPDHLLCVTADKGGRHMRGELLAERDGALQRVATVALARTSLRTVVARFRQSAIGRPASIRFAAEATPPGCAGPACVDTAPNAPGLATLTLRTS